MTKIWKKTDTLWGVSVAMPSNGIRIAPSECLGFYNTQAKCTAAITEFWRQVREIQKLRTPQHEMVNDSIIIALRMRIKSEENRAKHDREKLQRQHQQKEQLNQIKDKLEQAEYQLSWFTQREEAWEHADREHWAAIKLQKWWRKKMLVRRLRDEKIRKNYEAAASTAAASTADDDDDCWYTHTHRTSKN